MKLKNEHGWNWDWSDPNCPDVTEGTLYGETTNYIISGCIVGDYKMDPMKLLDISLKNIRNIKL